MIDGRKQIRLTVCLFLVVVFFLTAGTETASAKRVLTGTVSDTDDMPVVGATVYLYEKGTMVSATATDEGGAFVIAIPETVADSTTLRVSSLGHAPWKTDLAALADKDSLGIVLTISQLRVSSVTVTPKQEVEIRKIAINRREIDEAAKYSLVPSNPLGAVRKPHAVRQGSGHSSKLRMSGTNPMYYLNGVEIGYDPHHFGAISIIPGVVVNRIEVYPSGAPMSLGRPAAIDMNVVAPFGRKFGGDLMLSAVAGTGSISLGTERTYFLAAFRESFLDKLYGTLSNDEGRVTIPPTSFRDIFISAGADPASRTRLVVDYYRSRGELAYRLGGNTRNPGGIDIRQKTHREYGGIRISRTWVASSATLYAGCKQTTEEYRSRAVGSSPDAYFVDLTTRRRTYLAGLNQRFELGGIKFELGHRVVFGGHRTLSLAQHNWNFLPADATDDNMFYYQDILNREYGAYRSQHRPRQMAAYASLSRRIGAVEFDFGARVSETNDLSRRWVPHFRGSVTVDITRSNRFSLSYGSYGEHPLNGVTEAYHVLIDDYLENLPPVRTHILSLVYARKSLSIGLNHKYISDRPAVIPAVEEAATTDTSTIALTVQPYGAVSFWGGNITYDTDRLLFDGLSLSGYYAYSRADKIIGRTIIPYELNAAHTLFARSRYTLSRTFLVGAELSVRSGFAYTPVVAVDPVSKSADDKAAYWSSVQVKNSDRLPTYLSLNLRVEVALKAVTIFAAVSNVTDHSNPIIHTAGGFVYDPGILPTIGLRRSF